MEVKGRSNLHKVGPQPITTKPCSPREKILPEPCPKDGEKGIPLIQLKIKLMFSSSYSSCIFFQNNLEERYWNIQNAS